MTNLPTFCKVISWITSLIPLKNLPIQMCDTCIDAPNFSLLHRGLRLAEKLITAKPTYAVHKSSKIENENGSQIHCSGLPVLLMAAGAGGGDQLIWHNTNQQIEAHHYE